MSFLLNFLLFISSLSLFIFLLTFAICSTFYNPLFSKRVKRKKMAALYPSMDLKEENPTAYQAHPCEWVIVHELIDRVTFSGDSNQNLEYWIDVVELFTRGLDQASIIRNAELTCRDAALTLLRRTWNRQLAENQSDWEEIKKTLRFYFNKGQVNTFLELTQQDFTESIFSFWYKAELVFRQSNLLQFQQIDQFVRKLNPKSKKLLKQISDPQSFSSLELLVEKLHSLEMAEKLQSKKKKQKTLQCYCSCQ